jgi:hypothetical protein
MTPSQLTPPSAQTLKKYGITAEVWYTYLDLQDGKCPICEREFTSKMRPCIDHLHVTGFKKMVREKKAKYIRGLLCLWCNHRLVAKGMTTERAYNIYEYLSDFDMRRIDDQR